jgi:hypothetical protein
MKNILLVLISFVIIGCTTVSPVTNTVDLTNTDFINAKDFKEGKACEIYLIGFIGPFGNAQIIKAIQENYIKKVYAVDKYFSNWILFQRRCVLVYGEEMTRPEKIERKIKEERIKKKRDAFLEKKKKENDFNRQSETFLEWLWGN